MIDRTFLIRLPDLAEGLPQHFFRTVPWPDWRKKEDYQGIEEQLAELVARRQALSRMAELPDAVRPALGLTEPLRGRRSTREAYDPLLDHRIAWEFLRRNSDYQLDWAIWSRARERARGDERAVLARFDAEEAIRRKYGVDIAFDKPPDPFAGDLPKFVTTDEERSRKARRSVSNFASYLRVADGLAAGVRRSEIAAVVFPGEGGKKRLERAVAACKALVGGDYLRIASRHVDWLS
ncbi:transcriptional regulator domain-containing protein [Nitrospirillum amazonense]|uniref:transcriptional regulator domain-containing protein n=1 Tax=Nitrospirillum amazonense TaxID=28077 RepID=UPI0024122CBF|nr:DUF6499 domain-containing protein [Nitrospirillum amazonense]MDG3440154.1 DUF6499 domain-containing protein [Nitrospirillum amazonense]